MKYVTDTVIDSLNLNDYAGVSDSSHDVKPGEIFVAVTGERHDGHDYITKAIESGATLIVMNEGRQELLSLLPAGVKACFVPNTRTVLALIASHFYSEPEKIVAVTGTSGKTSVAFFAQQLLSMLGMAAVSIGSLGVMKQDENIKPDGILNTPGSIQLHKLLKELKESGMRFVIMETSSHGLAQHRVDSIAFKGAAFTSFSRDHLDYHQDMQKYLQAKLYLFQHLLAPGSFAMINSDMGQASNKALKACLSRGLETFSYGYQGNFLKMVAYNKNSTEVSFLFEGKPYKFKTTLFGEFQAHNALCALGIVLNLGFKIDQCVTLLEKLPGVPGRMQRVGEKNIYIDNSHKPDALKKALLAMRAHMPSNGRLIVVFGCGGDRDKGKRPQMGEVADKLADVVIITDDNPRSEEPKQIRREIIANRTNFLEIGNRRDAIYYALEHARSSDFVLIAGRGCEKFQLVGSDKIPFEDYQIALQASKNSPRVQNLS